MTKAEKFRERMMSIGVYTKRSGVKYVMSGGKKKKGDPDMFRQSWLNKAKWHERRDRKFKEGQHEEKETRIRKRYD